MARAPHILDVYAAVTGLSRSSLGVLDDHMRSAGVRTNSGRGRSAAHMTCRDAAHLIVASCASRELRDAADTIHRFAATRPLDRKPARRRYRKTGIEELMALPDDHNLIDALEAKLISVTTGSRADARRSRHSKRPAQQLPMIEIGLTQPMTIGDIRFSDIGAEVLNVRFCLPEEPPEELGFRTKAQLNLYASWLARERAPGDATTYTRITERTLVALADALSPPEETE